MKSKQGIFAGHVTPPGVRRSGSTVAEIGPTDPRLSLEAKMRSRKRFNGSESQACRTRLWPTDKNPITPILAEPSHYEDHTSYQPSTLCAMGKRRGPFFLKSQNLYVTQTQWFAIIRHFLGDGVWVAVGVSRKPGIARGTAANHRRRAWSPENLRRPRVKSSLACYPIKSDASFLCHESWFFSDVGGKVPPRLTLAPTTLLISRSCPSNVSTSSQILGNFHRSGFLNLIWSVRNDLNTLTCYATLSSP